MESLLEASWTELPEAGIIWTINKFKNKVWYTSYSEHSCSPCLHEGLVLRAYSSDKRCWDPPQGWSRAFLSRLLSVVGSSWFKRCSKRHMFYFLTMPTLDMMPLNILLLFLNFSVLILPSSGSDQLWISESQSCETHINCIFIGKAQKRSAKRFL